MCKTVIIWIKKSKKFKNLIYIHMETKQPPALYHDVQTQNSENERGGGGGGEGGKNRA